MGTINSFLSMYACVRIRHCVIYMSKIGVFVREHMFSSLFVFAFVCMLLISVLEEMNWYLKKGIGKVVTGR